MIGRITNAQRRWNDSPQDRRASGRCPIVLGRMSMLVLGTRLGSDVHALEEWLDVPISRDHELRASHPVQRTDCVRRTQLTDEGET